MTENGSKTTVGNAAAPPRISYNRATLRDELVRDEGLRLRVYRCTAGKLTIGVGRNLDDVGIRPHETKELGIDKASVIAKGLTRNQAFFLLDSDIDVVEQQLDHRLPWWRSLSDARQRVLLNMAFNLGIVGLLGFRNTLAFIKAGSFPAAAAGMRASLWARQVGKRAERLAIMMVGG